MSTIFDFVTVAIFLGLVVMYFKYEKSEDQDILAYIWPSLGCAMANYFGNKGFEIAGWAFIGLTLLYTYQFIFRTRGAPDRRA